MLGMEIEFFRFRITQAKKLICFHGKSGETNCYVQHHRSTGFKAIYMFKDNSVTVAQQALKQRFDERPNFTLTQTRRVRSESRGPASWLSPE